MKKILTVLCLLAVCGNAQAQKTKKNSKNAKDAETTAPQPSPEDMAARRSLLESRRMTPQNDRLMQLGGHWRQEMKVWRLPADKEPVITRLECDTRPVAEGRFMQMNIMGETDGIRYEGTAIMGFDNNAQKYQRIWFDNFGSSMLFLEGTEDAKNHDIVFTGTVTDPHTRRAVNVRQVLHIESPERNVLEIYQELEGGKMFKSMEVVSTR